MVTSCQRIVTSLLFFQFMADLGQCRIQIPNVWSIKFKFSFIVFYLTKTEKKTLKTTELKNLEDSFHIIALRRDIIFAKKS